MWNPFDEDYTVVKTIFGWIGKALLVLIPVLAIVYGVFVLFRTGPATPLSNPLSKYFVPEVIPSATPVTDTNPWQNEAWLSSSEARALREKENIVNLAFLSDGQALYSKDHSVILMEEGWTKAIVLGLENMTVEATSVRFVIKGNDYTLNIYQPFVSAEYPSRVYIVDSLGVIWGLDLANVSLVSIQTAVEALPVQLAPNPDLTFTY